MYIKRQPLGQGNLRFGKSRRRFPFGLIVLYLVILSAALIVIWQMDKIQPRVLAALGPTLTPTPSSSYWQQMAEAAYYQGDLNQSVEYYREAVRLEPDNVGLLVAYARVLTLTENPDNYDEAIAIANQAILLAPEDPSGYAVKARTLDWMGEYDQAAVEALRAIELDVTYAPGHAYLAEAYTDLGQLDQARTQAEMAVELDPYNVDARRNYAYVLEYHGEYQNAIQQYLQAIQLHPNLLDLWYGLARNYRGAWSRTGSEAMFQKSVETYQQIIMRTPQEARPYVELGRTYLEAREDDAAQINLERAVSLICPECPLHSYNQIVAAGYQVPIDEAPATVYAPAWTRLGQVYHTRRNYEDAIAIYEELIAWSRANGQEPPLEAYLVTASDYYYLDLCDVAIPRAFAALDMYERERMDDANALNSILSVFVLCRDWAITPPSVAFEFPAGYEEPDVYLERQGSQPTSGDGG